MTRWKTRHRRKEAHIFWERPRRPGRRKFVTVGAHRHTITGTTEAIGGTFQLMLGRRRTGQLPYNASSEELQRAIDSAEWMDESSEMDGRAWLLLQNRLRGGPVEGLEKFARQYQGEFHVTTPAKENEDDSDS